MGQYKWAWLDMEMTGLDPDQDSVLEIAVAVTDFELNVIEKGPSIVINQPPNVLSQMSSFVREMHQKNGLLDDVATAVDTLQSAESRVLAFLAKHLEAQQSPLCGNSVSYDRRFLFKHMPKLESFFHYRHVDVTSLKLILSAWCSKEKFYSKQATHRAMDDVLESIRELQFYRKHFNWQALHAFSDDGQADTSI